MKNLTVFDNGRPIFFLLIRQLTILAHTVPDALGRAYNRTRFIAQRKEMMQQWADYLDELKAGAKVIAFKQA